MKKIILLSVTAFLIGCNNTLKTEKTNEYLNGQRVEILTFDGCEYVYFRAGSASWGGHKGNCKNHKK